MNALQTNPVQRRTLQTAVGLAVFTAPAYLLIAWNILGVGDLQTDEKPAGIIYFAAGCYLAGGLLILLRNRWLLLFGAFINAMVILFFFNAGRGLRAMIVYPAFGYGCSFASSHPSLQDNTLLRMAAGKRVAAEGCTGRFGHRTVRCAGRVHIPVRHADRRLHQGPIYDPR